jgi:hypothetical protein
LKARLFGAHREAGDETAPVIRAAAGPSRRPVAGFDPEARVHLVDVKIDSLVVATDYEFVELASYLGRESVTCGPLGAGLGGSPSGENVHTTSVLSRNGWGDDAAAG